MTAILHVVQMILCRLLMVKSCKIDAADSRANWLQGSLCTGITREDVYSAGNSDWHVLVAVII